MEKETEVLETQNHQDEVVINEEETLSPEEIADLKHKAEVSSQNYERAKKAEAEKKALEQKLKEVEKSTKSEGDNLSQKDLIALVRANIHDDDIEAVNKFAKGNEISLAEALKNDDLKAILDRRAEIRKSAENANTGQTRKAAPKLSDQDILNKASKGEIPEKGSEEAEKLFWAKRGGKR